ncbi:hypothetical protein FRB94_008598 [Tulasnella sp. JGI-2019a]|nr:hypothetical protein FRB93_008388 [Tulasnella sp. JGI-2019a]KAG8995985.1 hypothetical protein FRB94_008598 [Tulasnella sp. JGI-2019a]KAG9027124.1 hypothetical protein FRB95_008121 [Tulasnella sp. JGI-2019a]
MKNVKRYIYFQCLPNVKKRFFAAIPGLQGKSFESVFNSLEPELFDKQWKVPTEKLPGEQLEKRDERWLIEAMLTEINAHGDGITEDEIPREYNGEAEQLVPSTWAAGYVFLILQGALQDIRTSIEELEGHKEQGQIWEVGT